ncbi:MAG: zinc-dependent metalloprotease [Planctomycetaceae bacterium]|nr:zinc-dependent metalloprotease [Planctomycetaceae bacterium]
MRRFGLLGLALLFLASPLSAQEKSPAAEKSKYQQLTEGKEKLAGMWTVHRKEQQLLVELTPADLKRDYIIITSIAKGISRGSVLGGMSWNFGDDAIWGFRVVDEKLFVLQRNVRFRAKPNTPEATAVDLAYSDSVIYALPILTKSPSGNLLVDLGTVFMNDDQHIGREIGPGFRFMSDRSTWAKVKNFDHNLELQVNAVYSGSTPLETVPDSRGVQVNVHYSVSVLPPVGANGYKTRVADDRVGYFLTAIKDFSEKDEPEHFVRLINRWNLQKLDPNIDLSPPKEPIRFYIENTVPVALRPTIEAGILEWNKAFEKLGFAGAIRVDLQPSDPDFDPENVHYNTFRWITADAGFAMGPSRVDPRTGQILDADIIFDASFLDSWSSRWETFGPDAKKQFLPNWSPEDDLLLAGHPVTHGSPHNCQYCREMQRQLGFAGAVLMGKGVSADGTLPKELIHEGLKEVVMHEVGHTLGLRHNFKASTWKSLESIQDKDSGRREGTVASVMDYAPANIAADPKDQGLYYSQTLGPYDYWAIEYGYKPIKGDEAAELKKIAARGAEEGLDYATDEDTRSFDPDPSTNRFDLGSDPLAFVARQMDHAMSIMPKVVEKTVGEGEGYQRARQAFGLLLGEYWRSAGMAARFPGGVYVHRDHKGDEDARQPFTVVEAEKQRDAMKLLARTVFAPEIDGETLNYLAASRWSHWGSASTTRLDYPIHDTVLSMQQMILSQLLDSMRLQRILDNETRVAAEVEAYTLPEHFDLLTDSVYSEWAIPEGDNKEFTNRKPLVDSYRRNLQRETLRRLAYLVTHGGGAPADARTIARMKLQQLNSKADELLKAKGIKLDEYTRAHLLDSQAVIQQALNAEVSIGSAS